MTDKSPKTKRRPPGEKTTDGKQDADWGFDAGETDPAVEKKLGLVLVVCLLAGFGFVFFQKYRLLNADNAQTKVEDAATTTNAGVSELNEPPATDGLAFLSDATSSAGESPYYETPAEPTPTPAAKSDWTLTQAEVPQSAVPQSSFTPTGSAGLPPLPDETPAEAFDPFASADAAPTQQSTPEPTPGNSQTLTWNDPLPADSDETFTEPEAPAQSEPDPFLADEPHVAAAAPPMEISPFGVEVAAEPETQEEPTLTLDAMPQTESEPEPLDQPQPEMTFLDETPALAEQPSSDQSFDPFQSNDEPTEEVAAVPETAPKPFGYIAPPVREQPVAKQPLPEQPTQRSIVEQPIQKTIVEPPAWPFSEKSNQVDTETPAPFPGQTSLAAKQPTKSDGQWPTSEPAATASPAPSTPPNPFSFDATTTRPIAASPTAPQPTIGVREIAVTPSDTFWSISEREYGSARYFTALAHFNKDRVPAPEKLRAGMKICVPPPEVLEDTFPEMFRAAEAARAAISPISGSSTDTAAEPSGLFVDELRRPHYRVGERDTLSSIAQASLGRSSRWTEIYDLNRDQLTSPSTLKIGMVLKLPPEAAPVAVSPAGGFFR